MISEVLRFGAFELNTRTCELSKHGHRLPLPPQPARLLSLLASRQGQLVTREEIRAHLWPGTVFVDFDLGLNSCLAHLRTILGDRARTPHYIETLSRRGYRFIARVESVRSVQQPTVAVLPFANLGGDPSLEYFADGMTDVLITELASISALRVISRQTVLHLKGSDKPLVAIARDLGVEALVEGTVLHAGTSIRITAQLVAVAPERHVWAHAYECAPSDVISIQRGVARAVAEGVSAALTPSELARLSHPVRVQPAAHQAYLKGLFQRGDWSREGLRKAMHSFEEAIAIDDTFAPPHVGLGNLFNDLGYWGHMPLKQAFPRAKQEALAALALDEGLAGAHTVLAWVHWWHDWDLEACDRERRRALELGPSDVGSLLMSGMFRLAECQETEEGIEEIRLGLKLDPLSQVMNFCLAWNYLFAGNLKLARDQAQATLDLFPASVQACYVLGLAELALGKPQEAIAALEKATAIARDPLSLAYLGYACGVTGSKDRTRELLAEVTDLRARSFVSLKPFIVLHIGLAEYDRALDHLEEAYRVRDPILFHVPRVPIFAPLAAEPRFCAVMGRVPVFRPSATPAGRPGPQFGSRRFGTAAPSGTRRRSARSTPPA
ncbi:MAG TPA: winged helix-turn-helix domain-containing protein [Vicinamibacterales bacterium]|nr:winged helix-turn-helix domain-containing protein [Vicinamibacterales bacterium]